MLTGVRVGEAVRVSMGSVLEGGVLLAGELRVFLEGDDRDFCEEMHGGLDLTVCVRVELPSSLVVKALSSHIFSISLNIDAFCQFLWGQMAINKAPSAVRIVCCWMVCGIV